jgi:hypothetical protein
MLAIRIDAMVGSWKINSLYYETPSGKCTLGLFRRTERETTEGFGDLEHLDWHFKREEIVEVLNVLWSVLQAQGENRIGDEVFQDLIMKVYTRREIEREKVLE